MSARLSLATCSEGHRTYPARPDCPACGRETALVVAETHGLIVTWTRIERPPEGFEAPQTVVLVRLTAGPDEAHPPLVLAGYRHGTPRTGQRVRIQDGPDHPVAEPY